MAQRTQFTCYFCQKTITNETEMGHISLCGSVLVPCPNKCGSYVPRIDLNKHKRECVNNVNKSTTSVDREPNTLSLDRRSDSSGRNLREAFNRLEEELKKLNVKLSNVEQRNTVDNAQGTVSQLQYYKMIQIQQKQELDKIKYQQQTIYEWKNAISLQLENLRHSIDVLQKSNYELGTNWMSLQQKLMELNRIQYDIDTIHDLIRKHHNSNTQTAVEFTNKLQEFNDLFQQENTTITALWNEQKVIVDQHQLDIDGIQKVIDEHRAKHSSIVFDLKTTTQLALETSEKFEIQERQFNEIKCSLEQLKFDMEILENLASNSDSGLPTKYPGHMMFKINDFQAKLATAKESDTVLKIYLNGLKKWKDRYCLISIHVLKGDYDDLLKWPCHIEGTIILRDLEDLDDPKHISKYISAKRQMGDEDSGEPQESSSSYIFIPHQTLMKSKYLKNDAIYLEIKIQSNRKSTETSL